MTADISDQPELYGSSELASTFDALAFRFGSLAAVLDEETAAALAGDSDGLRDCYARKLELTGAVETDEADLRRILEQVSNATAAATLTSERRAAMAIARQRLQGAMARNETSLRAMGEAIRRIFEGAARVVADDAIGYGPSRIPGDGRLFEERMA